MDTNLVLLFFGALLLAFIVGVVVMKLIDPYERKKKKNRYKNKEQGFLIFELITT